MKAALSGLEVVRPRNLGQALAALEDSTANDRIVPLAGGTDVFVYLNAGSLAARRYLDLGSLSELRGIRAGKDGLALGALTTFREIREHPIVGRRFPSLRAAAMEIGAWQIQNRATLAGNIANASPAGDSLPVLLAHGAVLQVRSVRGAREIPFDKLYRGYRDLALDPGELIVSVSLPYPPARSVSFFRKVGTRRAQSISKVVFCGLIARELQGNASHVRLAFGSVAPVPLRARRAEESLFGRKSSAEASAMALRALAEDIAPIDDIRSTREYRLTVAGNVLAQFLRAEHPTGAGPARRS